MSYGPRNKVINAEKGKSKQCTEVQSSMIDNNEIRNQNKIAITLNNYFLSIADSVITENNKHVNTANSLNYLLSNFKKPFTKMNWHYTSTYEKEKNHKILKIKKFLCV